MPTSLLESSLFENAIQGARGQIVAQLPGDGDASWFRAMLELAVAALRRDETPAVVVQHPQQLADFHRASISGPVPPVRPARRGGITFTLTGRGERMRASGPVERDVRRP